MTEAILFPKPPTTLEEASTFLAWVADASLSGLIDKHRAFGATKAVEAWIRCENYRQAISDLKKQVAQLRKTPKSDG